MDEGTRDVQFLLRQLMQTSFHDMKALGWGSDQRKTALALLSIDLSGRFFGQDEAAIAMAAVNAVMHDRLAGLEPAARDFIRRGIDVLVICPLAKELNPSLVSFGLDPFAVEEANLKGSKIYLKEVTRQDLRSVRVAISVINKPRNVPVAIQTKNLI